MRGEPTTIEVLAMIAKLEDFVNQSKYIPAVRFYRSKVLLGLISKALTVGRAVCVLIDAGFAGEAFGLTRTLAEIFFTARYISNKDTEKRAGQYVEHLGKTHEQLSRISAKHYPAKPLLLVDKRSAELAKKYKSAHSWTDLRGQARAMALEPDTFESDRSGHPLREEFDYDFIYWETSQFVHATIESLIAHGCKQGEYFRVRANIHRERIYARQALFNILLFISKTFVSAFRGLQDDQPNDLLLEARQMMRAFAPRKKPA